MNNLHKVHGCFDVCSKNLLMACTLFTLLHAIIARDLYAHPMEEKEQIKLQKACTWTIVLQNRY